MLTLNQIFHQFKNYEGECCLYFLEIVITGNGINTNIQLMSVIEETYGRSGEKCMVFPSYNTACRCRSFIKEKSTLSSCPVRIVQLATQAPAEDKPEEIQANVSVVFFPESEFSIAKQYWQHTGEGVSSRLGEYVLNRLPSADGSVHNSYQEHHRRNSASPSLAAQAKETSDNANETNEQSQFVEQRFGRNMDLHHAADAKKIIKRRISGKVIDDETNQYGQHRENVSENDVYLFSTGMTSIFTAHRLCMAALGNDLKSVCFGFPYTDTLKILEKWGPGVLFLGKGDEADLDDLEKRLEGGERYMALFTEFPSNPLLKSPNMQRIRQLADKYKFAVVVDETVGNFLNVHVLPFADVVVSSLTKVFSGDSNVMAGSLVLNPKSTFYELFKKNMSEIYEDNFWAEDALFLERNSRDLEDRSAKINRNAEAVAELFLKCDLIKDVFYPKLVPSRGNYDACKIESGGYGGLMSIVFKDPQDAPVFFDAVNIAKGPSLGTNFTLTCPYTIIAHYLELDFVEKYGVDKHLVRISIGLEDSSTLIDVFTTALEIVKKSHDSRQ